MTALEVLDEIERVLLANGSIEPTRPRLLSERGGRPSGREAGREVPRIRAGAMKRLSRAELEAVFTSAWARTKSHGDVAEAIQRAVLANVGIGTDESVRVGPRAIRPPRWTPDQDTRIDDIVEAVSLYRLIPTDEIKVTRRGIRLGRKRPIARARHEAAWLIRVTLQHSYETIGIALGGIDHSSILSACRKIQGLVDADPAYGERLLAIAAGAMAGGRKAA